MKTVYLARFVERTREELRVLWQHMSYSDIQTREEAPFAYIEDNTLFNEALLHLHEKEVERLEQKFSILKPIFEKIGMHQSMLREIEEFEIQSKDPERLFKRDPGRLLREEKFRKIISQKLPSVRMKKKKKLVGNFVIEVHKRLSSDIFKD